MLGTGNNSRGLFCCCAVTRVPWHSEGAVTKAASLWQDAVQGIQRQLLINVDYRSIEMQSAPQFRATFH